MLDYKNDNFEISTPYPAGWFVKEHSDGDSKQVFISEKEIKKSEDMFKTGIVITKICNYSKYFGYEFASSEEAAKQIVESHLSDFMENARDYYLGSFGPASSGGRSRPYVADLRFVCNDASRVREYIFVAYEENTLVFVTMEAPDSEFLKYKDLYDTIIASIRVF
ncbi:MAG: hypothetical protein PHO00_00215 [bacterium]|nr:hypothetical protein [bacterium]